MEIDAKEIVRALHLFFCKGDVFEIRCLEAVTERGSNSYQTRPHVESGYFDYNHIENVPAALGHIKSARGIYVTPNPVNPDLLARCANRIMAAQTGSTTNDNHIIRRRWLLIDCDVEHNGISGISSSDEEHANAQQAAEHIRDKLFECNWPDPIIIDTGNGASLMYPIDLDVSAGSNAMIAAVIDALQFYNTKDIKIDPQVKNLARVWRLPGTMNCKGDNIPERPHRMAHLLYVPENGIEFVGRDQLEQIADWQYNKEREKAKATTQTIGYVQSGFDLDQWIRQYCPDVSEPVQQGNQRKWYFKECPFSSGHSSPQGAKDTYIGQYDSGAFFFKCSHSHCANYKFDDLRDLLEPDWRTKHSQIDAGVNLNGILNPQQQQTQIQIQNNDILDDIPEDELKEEDDFIPFPEECYNVPGFIKDVMDITLKYASIPNRPLALSGALALMSIICAQKVETETQLHSNIYILALADSGVGKEKPIDVAHEILKQIGMSDNEINGVSSGEGLEDALVTRQARIWFCDEFYSVLHDMMNEYADRKNTLVRYLLTLYSNTQYFVTRVKSGKDGTIINNPHLTLYATTTTNGFFENLSERFLNDGMFSRVNIIIAEKSKERKRPRRTVIPEEVIQKAKMWYDFMPQGSGNLNIKPMLVPMTQSADELADKIFDEQTKILDGLENNDEHNDYETSAWNRYWEITMRYALLYACSDAISPEKTIITQEAISWASSFVKWDISNKIQMTRSRYYRNTFERDCEFVIKFMLRWHSKNKNKPMPAWQFNRKSKFLKDKKIIVENLISKKRLFHDELHQIGAGRPADIYWLAEFPPIKKEKEEDKK